jgi:hypothetical protein
VTDGLSGVPPRPGELPASDRPSSADRLGTALNWARQALPDAATAEACAVEVVRRFVVRCGPEWLQNKDDEIRLQFSAATVLLQERGIL